MRSFTLDGNLPVARRYAQSVEDFVTAIDGRKINKPWTGIGKIIIVV